MSTPHTVPIQPFNDALRSRIVSALSEVFERRFASFGQDYDPDALGEATDAVIALFVSELLGVSVELLPQRIIGNGTLRIDPSHAPRFSVESIQGTTG